MGASGWSYFVPYQSDLNQALQSLRQQIFRGGAYEKPYAGSAEDFSRYLPKELEPLRDVMLAEFRRKQRALLRKARTIGQLLRQAAEEGTHSILDVSHVSDIRTFGAIAPLSVEQLIEVFGTERPTHEAVERVAQSGRLASFYGRWEGICAIVYEDSEPTEIYFEGASGD